MNASDAIIERLGDKVWDTLENAGHQTAPEGTDRYGFDVLKPYEGPGDHVAVIARFDAAMTGMGTPGVRRGVFYRYENTLTDAGFHVERFELDGSLLALLVATGHEPIRRAAITLRAVASEARGCAIIETGGDA